MGGSSDTAPQPAEMQLFELARRMQDRAYAPYSRFHVGAAILADDGTLHGGCNVENAAYPQGTCAEAGAIAAMVAAGAHHIAVILTVADGEQLTTPCGGCRQKIREFASPETVVLAAGPEGVRARFTLDELLPRSFGPAHLHGRES